MSPLRTLAGALVATAALFAASAGIGADGAGSPPEQSVAGRWIVQLVPSADADGVAAEHSRAYGARVQRVYRYAIEGYAALMSESAAAQVARDPRVQRVERDQVATATAQTVPTGVDRSYEPATANTSAASGLTIDGRDDKRVDVDVAVIDTGIDHAHQGLVVAGGADCVDSQWWTGNCTTGLPGDDNGHGTHVAGTVGALDDGNDVVGVAPGARLWAVKVLNAQGSGYFSDIIGGVDWVTAKAGTIEVVNMSLGCLDCTSQPLTDAINNSISKGVVYVAAAGNDAQLASRSIPGNIPAVITVAALADFNGVAGGGAPWTCRSDVDDTLADFSNYGSAVDIAAPGVCITSTARGGGVTVLSGTSMAAPHVAGAAALLASVTNPATASDVATLRNTLVADAQASFVSGTHTFKVLDVTSYAPSTVAGTDTGTTEPPPDPTEPSPTCRGKGKKAC